MEEHRNKHYIHIDKDGRIIDGWSDGLYPNRDSTGAICINKYGGHQFRLFSDGEENPIMHDGDGVPLYKWEKDQVVRRSEKEVQEDRLMDLFGKAD